MAITIETTRLVLKQFTLEDAENLFKLNSDPEVTKYVGDSPYTSIEEAYDFIKGYDQYEKYGQGRLNMFEKATGDYVGWCGLKYLKDKNHTDLGYRLLKKYWGKGYATEASIACLNYGFETLNLGEIVATAMLENTASINVFKKLGFKYSHDTDDHGHRCVLYKLTKEEWK